MTRDYILGVLVSGRGSNFAAIAAAIEDGRLARAKIGVVIADRPDTAALQLAEAKGLPHFVVSVSSSSDRDQQILALLQKYKVDLVILAGYLRLIGPPLLGAYPSKVLNIHPAPLPRFGGKGMYGPRLHQAVLDAGVATSGPTIHLVNAAYDEGQILGHVAVPVRPDDSAESLAARILVVEHDLYWRVIDRFIQESPRPETSS